MKPLNQRLVRAARRINFVWRFLAPMIVSGQSNRDAYPKSILVVDLHLIGDMVLLVPLPSCLRHSHPDARIVFPARPWAAGIVLPENFVDEHVLFVAPWVKRRGLLSVIDHRQN